MSSLKVFHIITKLELGGAQGNTLYTVTHLDREKFSASLVCGRGGILDPDAEKTGVPVHFIDALVRPINPVKDVLAVIALYKLFKLHKPDVVHTHSSKAGILGRLAARLAGVPHTVHTFHGFGFNHEQSSPVRWVYIMAEKLCAGMAERLVFVSRANRLEAGMLGIGRQETYRVIRSGVKLADYPDMVCDREALRKQFGLPPQVPVVVSVGNLKPQKNPLDFVRMAAIVHKQHPSAHFLYIGDGMLRPKVEQLARELGADKYCHFPGWRTDIAQVLSLASVFVLTSLWEGLPRSLVEALKSGVPCVAYATDGVCDILQDDENGFLVPKKNYAELAQDVTAMLRDPNLRVGLAAGAADTDLEDFDIDAMVRAQENLYAGIAGAA